MKVLIALLLVIAASHAQARPCTFSAEFYTIYTNDPRSPDVPLAERQEQRINQFIYENGLPFGIEGAADLKIVGTYTYKSKCVDWRCSWKQPHGNGGRLGVYDRYNRLLKEVVVSGKDGDRIVVDLLQKMRRKIKSFAECED